jgi:hypothetical protein
VTADRWRWRGTVALTGVALAFCLLPLIPQVDPINSDWPAFATGARLIVENPSHLYDFEAQRKTELAVTNGRVLITLGIHGILPFLAPAWVALVAVPFELAGSDVGGRLWMLFGLACFGLGLYLAVRPRAPAAILPAFATLPTALMLLNAQLGGLVALGIGAALALWNRPYVAGLALGLTLVKPQLVVPIGFGLLITRRWRVIAGWATAGVALLAVTLLLNPRWVFDWLPALSTPVRAGSREVDLAHFGTAFPDQLQLYGVVLLSLFALGGTLVMAIRCRHNFRAAAAVLVAGGVLAAPHALPADLVLVALALAIWGEATWIEWLALSLGAAVAAIAPAPYPAVAGVVLVLWLLFRMVRLRESARQGAASAPGAKEPSST